MNQFFTNIKDRLKTPEGGQYMATLGAGILGGMAQGDRDRADRRMTGAGNIYNAKAAQAQAAQNTASNLFGNYVDARQGFGENTMSDIFAPQQFLSGQSKAAGNALQAAIFPDIAKLAGQTFNPATMMSTLRDPSRNLYKGVDLAASGAKLAQAMGPQLQQLLDINNMAAGQDARSDFMRRYGQAASQRNPLIDATDVTAYGLTPDDQFSMDQFAAGEREGFLGEEGRYRSGMQQGLDQLNQATTAYERMMQDEMKKGGGFLNFLGKLAGLGLSIAPVFTGLPPVKGK